MSVQRVESLPSSKLCMAEGCDVTLSDLPKYCQQRRLCPTHIKANSLKRKGQGDTLWRFCQQCGKLELLSAFDGARRSCRVQLARRRAAASRAAGVSTGFAAANDISNCFAAANDVDDAAAAACHAACFAGMPVPLSSDVTPHQEQQLLQQQQPWEEWIMLQRQRLQHRQALLEQELLLMREQQRAEAELTALMQQYMQMQQHRQMLGAQSPLDAGTAMLSSPPSSATAVGAAGQPSWSVSMGLGQATTFAPMVASISEPLTASWAAAAHNSSSSSMSNMLTPCFSYVPGATGSFSPSSTSSLTATAAGAAAAGATAGAGAAPGAAAYPQNTADQQMRDRAVMKDFDELLQAAFYEQQADAILSTGSNCVMPAACASPTPSSSQLLLPQQLQQLPVNAAASAPVAAMHVHDAAAWAGAHSSHLASGMHWAGGASAATPLPARFVGASAVDDVMDLAGAGEDDDDDEVMELVPPPTAQPHTTGGSRKSMEELADILEMALLEAGAQALPPLP